MKLCFPVEKNKGLSSIIYNHFGSAPMFIIADSESNAVEIVDNADLGHDHGNCSPINALSGKKIDVLITGGIGAGAINKLNAMGIKVLRANASTVQEGISQYNSGSLGAMDSACDHNHGHEHGHSHSAIKPHKHQ